MRVYGLKLHEVLWSEPAVQVALLFRQWRSAVAGDQGLTLLEAELLATRFGKVTTYGR